MQSYRSEFNATKPLQFCTQIRSEVRRKLKNLENPDLKKSKPKKSDTLAAPSVLLTTASSSTATTTTTTSKTRKSISFGSRISLSNLVNRTDISGILNKVDELENDMRGDDDDTYSDTDDDDNDEDDSYDEE